MIENIYSFITVIFFGFLLSGCGIAERGTKPGGDYPDGTPLAASGSLNENSVKDQLWAAHGEWEGTPYVLGGSGINGVDCSSFTQIVFQDFFGIDLPRNTREQLQIGSSVRRQHIRPGDLIFFRTGSNLLHVGIALDGGEFVHASVSQGVTTSNLSDRYWSGKYIGSRRVLE